MGPVNSGGGQGQVTFLPSGQPYVTNLTDLAGYQTMQWGNWEFIEQSLYDSFSYVAAGIVSQTMFQQPVGQGTGFGGAAKTTSDTNMQIAGQLSNGNMQLVTSVEIEFQPTTPTVAAAMPAAFGAQAVAVQINDAYIFWRSGNLQFAILQKVYLTEAPLMRFPSTSDFSLQAAVADIAPNGAGTGNMQSRIAFASSYGPAYMLSPENLLIPQTTAFKVSLNWPEGLQAITNPGRVFVHLNGMAARLAQ